ncbi:unnamed protein product [Prorocentrum cordatum]|uniref:Uncharacterized protein n=1 Tax=Prorocentrum cordatum TaxID=2364126 RepID=A0ABN9XFJ6_9DINO|nr:unnamed protein product [Polarella glacialis]
MMAAGVEQDSTVRASLVRAFGLAAAQLAPAGGAPGAAAEREAARGRLLAHVWSVIQEAKREGPIPAVLFDAVVHAYCDAGLPAHAEELLGMGAELGCEPSAEAFARVLHALEGEPRQFFALWERMLAETGARPGPLAMQLALGVAAASRDARRAQAVLELMFAAREAPAAEAADALRSLPPGPEAAAVRRLLNELGRA